MGNICCAVKKSRYTFIALHTPHFTNLIQSKIVSNVSNLSCISCHQLITCKTSVIVKCNNCNYIIGHADCIEPIMNEPCLLCDY
jgi:hypothetical protein